MAIQSEKQVAEKFVYLQEFIVGMLSDSVSLHHCKWVLDHLPPQSHLLDDVVSSNRAQLKASVRRTPSPAT